MPRSQCYGEKVDMRNVGSSRISRGGWCPMVPMTPLSLDVMLSPCVTTTCRGRDHTAGRSEMNYELSLLEWWK